MHLMNTETKIQKTLHHGTEGHGCGWLKLRVEKWKKKVSANELEILERII